MKTNNTKICRTCMENKNITEYYKTYNKNKNKYYHSLDCNKCFLIKAKRNKYKDNSKYFCLKCNYESDKEFYNINNTANKYNKYCSNCFNSLVKKCKTCKTDRLFSEFEIKKQVETERAIEYEYLSMTCMLCINPTNKFCHSCKEIFNVSNFYKHKRTYDGLSNICKKCDKIHSDNRRNESEECKKYKEKEKIREKLYSDGKITCNECNEIKEFEHFSKATSKSKDGSCKKIYNLICKKCKYLKIKKRINEDIAFKLRKSTSTNVRIAFKRQRMSKDNKSIEKYLPYTTKDLIAHIESTWKEYSWITSWDQWR